MQNGGDVDVVSQAQIVVYALLNKLGKLLIDEVAVLQGVNDDNDNEGPRRYEQARQLVALVVAALNETNNMFLALRPHSGEAAKEAAARELAYDMDDCVDLFISRVKKAVGHPKAAFQEAYHVFGSEMQAIIARIRRLFSTPGQPLAPEGSAAGTDEQIAGLAKMVAAAEDADGKLKAFCVVGPKGATTAALQEVRRRREERFDCTAYVSVSQAAFGGSREMCELLRRVLQQMVKTVRTPGAVEAEILSGIEFMEEDELVTTLQVYLEDKRYLLLIDGVCTVAAWEAIRSKFSDNNRSSRIVVSTEAETVAEACGAAGVVVCRLNHHPQEVPGGANNPGEKVVPSCHRYDQLQAGLKHCMLYLSIFAKGCKITKRRLLYRWIAEGIVTDVRQGQSLLDLAESCFSKLVSKELVELDSATTTCWNMTCHVPDTVREVIVSDAIKQGFTCLVGASRGSTAHDGGGGSKVRILSIQGDAAAGLEGKDMRYLRSLSISRPQDRHKLLDRLAEFTLLKTLDLEGCTAVEDRHVRLVCGLVLLKFLSFKGTDITMVPDEIAALGSLQTLDVSGTCLTGLPDTVTDLVKLQCLYFSHKGHYEVVWMLPRGLRKMKALRAVSMAGVGDDVLVAQELGELTMLQELGIIVHSSGPVLQELARAIGQLQLRILHILPRFGGKKMNLLLDVPSPPLHLQYTRIAGEIDRLPDWVKLLSHLTEINLAWTSLRSDQILGVLCVLPSLLSITLWRNSYNDSELVARAEFKFPVLMMLSVVSDYDEHKVLRFEQGSMPTLETLEFRFSSRDKTIIGVEHLTGLKQVKLLGKRDNPSLKRAEEQLMSESNKRSSKFVVKVVG